METEASLGGTLVSLDTLNTLTMDTNFRELIEKAEEGQSVPRPNFQVDGKQIGSLELKNALDAANPSIPYVGIGLGKPLTIAIETVYVGAYPDAVAWIPGDQLGDVLVTSSNKAFHIPGSAPRAVHFFKPRAPRDDYLELRASEQGTRLAYYSPAVTDVSSILFTVEVSADREFSKVFGDSLAKAMSGAGALPVFAPAAPWLIAAGTAVPIAMKAVSMLAHPHTFFEQTVEVNFSRPGIGPAQPEALVLYPGGRSEDFKGFDRLIDFKKCNASGKPYRGTASYVVISLDGREQSAYANWAPVAASSAIVERFFQGDAFMEKALSLVTDSLATYNDVDFWRRANHELSEAADSTSEEAKQRRLDAFDALVKNIKSDDLRKAAEALRK